MQQKRRVDLQFRNFFFHLNLLFFSSSSSLAEEFPQVEMFIHVFNLSLEQHTHTHTRPSLFLLEICVHGSSCVEARRRRRMGGHSSGGIYLFKLPAPLSQSTSLPAAA